MKIIRVAVVFALAAAAALAQTTPIEEIGLQYQMLRVNSSSAIPSFTANGGSGSFQINFFDQVAGVLEISGVHNGNIHNVHLDNTWLTYLIGPRISLRNRNKRIIPAVECLIGGTTLFASVANPADPNGARLGGNSTGFAMALGGTLDIRLTQWANFRPMQLDWLLTRVNNSYNQNNLRYGAGFVFTFGKQ